MRKQIAVIGSVLAAVCLFIFSPVQVFAATNGYNTSTQSGSVDNVSYYVTVNDGRSAITSTSALRDPQVAGNSSTTKLYVTYNVENVAHFSFTIRNRDSVNYKVMDTNNFIVDFQPAQSAQLAEASKPHIILNTDNVDVWQLTTTTVSQSGTFLRMQIRYTGDPYLTPDEQIYFSFDVVWDTSVVLYQDVSTYTSFLGNPANGFETQIITNLVSGSSLGSVQIPSFTTKDADEFMSSNSSGILGKLWQQIHEVVQAVKDNGIDTSDSDYASSQSDLDSSTGSVNSTVNTQHSQETSYINQGYSDIGATGLRTFNFDGNQVLAITGVTGLFSRWWSALGPLTGVITFTLILRLAVTILRHRPAGGDDND